MSKLNDMFAEAKKYLSGGAAAGGRTHVAFGQPIYMARASGARLYDAEGREYLDYHNASGATMFGYNHPRLKAAYEKAYELGNFMNHDSEYHIELARRLCEFFPGAELARFCNTGTEVTLGAIRLARAYTGRELIVKFDGHFHGMHELIWYNSMFWQDHMGEMDPYGEVKTIPDTVGYPKCLEDTVKNVEFNNIDALEHVAQKYKGKIAGIIMEPISFDCGCCPPKTGYLQQVRALCDREGIVLIFDEVVTGLRFRPGSAAAYYGVTPDLMTLAKAAGGGFSSSYLLGREKIMRTLNPTGKMSMSGTYTGALLPTLISLECMKMVVEPWFYDHIDKLANLLYPGIDDLMQRHGIKGHVRGYGARFAIYFGVEDPEDDYDIRKVARLFDPVRNRQLTLECLKQGLYFHDYGNRSAPQMRGFSIQHTVEDINLTLDKLDNVFKTIR